MPGVQASGRFLEFCRRLPKNRDDPLQAKVDELLTAKQQLELALATARAAVAAQEQMVDSMLERLTATSAEPEVAAAKGVEAGIQGVKKLVKNPVATGT